MESLWKNDGFVSDGCIPPKSMIEEQFRYLKEQTDGKVIGRIKEYEGDYQDKYEVRNPFSKALSSMTALKTSDESVKTFDVQSVLGEQSDFVYEFYITSVATPKYKYRIGIMDYSVLLYPVHLVLELSLAEEIKIESQLVLNSQEEFVECLSKILNSNRVNSVIANLLKINGLS